ncbi:phage tail protein I [Salmonella enterica]|nr:phage tail protein I [Salmonella enterica]ECH4008103.1 phage tail protein I [Salmonella enterica subsp. enterica serovar Montevideo]EBM1330912.1 phage tail protein I [Salmonella enterica]ECT8738505.1 phage tail protein I [Salmonella enterica subsp. enterica serovar Montevideo]EHQ4812208.1 phage tail protein I [Salmonella enterica]
MADRRDIPLVPPLARDERFRILAGLAARLQDIDLTPLLVYLVDLTEPTALPWLADQFAITGDNGWNLAESEDARRALIKNAIELHRYKGTPWSIRQVIRNLGFGEVQIIEGGDGLDPAIAIKWPADTHWALYRIKLSQAITNDQARLMRKTLAAFAPARCELASLDFVAAPIRYNNTARYDGTYNHGSA